MTTTYQPADDPVSSSTLEPLGDLSPSEAAARLNLTPQTIRRQLVRGEFPARAYKIGSLWRIDRDDFERLTRRAS